MNFILLFASCINALARKYASEFAGWWKLARSDLCFGLSVRRRERAMKSGGEPAGTHCLEDYFNTPDQAPTPE
jgi:hypothetical protein